MSKIEEMNIYQKLVAITKELGYVSKNLDVGGKYKAVGETDILDAVKPLEEKYGVYSYPIDREIITHDVMEQESYGKTKIVYYIKIKTTYRFVNVDKQEEYVETISYSDGIDNGDKGAGKAMTYGDKYALMKAYKISTGEDPDANLSNDSTKTKRAKQEDSFIVGQIKKLLNNDIDKTNAILKHYGIQTLSQLDPMQEQQVYTKLKKG